MEKWPNFFIVGAAKAGTSSLFRYLKEIPGIYMPEFKEPHFFAPNPPKYDNYKPMQDKTKYLDLFKESTSEKMIGEASASYLRNPESPKLIHSTIPDAKIIISLRDPVERAFSHYLYKIRFNNETLSFLT